MWTQSTRPATALQAGSSADCRHSREPFDAAFRVINCRPDISPTAKLVHAHLVTLRRTGDAATQTEIGERLGLSRHQVWRATGDLVAAGLVIVTRRGQGRPNGYELVGVPDDDLDGRASRSRPVRQPVTGQPGIPTRARHSDQKRRGEELQGYIPKPIAPGMCFGCGKRGHQSGACPRYTGGELGSRYVHQ